MIRYLQGNLLESRAEALVNTVNTVGVMGKGIALMFKERFPENFRHYAEACKAHRVKTGEVFVTEARELNGARWIVNFPTKQHWRSPSKIEWIVEGLQSLRRFLLSHRLRSVAIPPLGAGNGGLHWPEVRDAIESALGDLDLDVMVYEPTRQYQNVAKREGVEALTPARALIAELVRRYSALGMECSVLEIQKLAWFLERAIERRTIDNPLRLRFTAHKYGPYADRLRHLLDGLDGSYLCCEKRLGDADPLDVIWFDDARREYVETYLRTEARAYLPALEETAARIDGFESPFGMELLATVDWLLAREGVSPTLEGVREGLRRWPAGAGERKLRIFDDHALTVALERLTHEAKRATGC